MQAKRSLKRGLIALSQGGICASWITAAGNINFANIWTVFIIQILTALIQLIFGGADSTTA